MMTMMTMQAYPAALKRIKSLKKCYESTGTKFFSLSMAILLYALVYDDDNDDYAGLSSGAGRHMSDVKRRKKILSRPSTFRLHKYN